MTTSQGEEVPTPARRGRKKRHIVEFPEPLWTEWEDPVEFSEALELHMRRHGDSDHHLQQVLSAQKARVNQTTIRTWRLSESFPGDPRSLAALNKLEHRYRLPLNYFREKLPASGKAATAHRLKGISRAERRRLSWHLPDDFDSLPAAKRDEILEWVRSVIVSGATEYRRYHAQAMRHRFAVRFDCAPRQPRVAGAVEVFDEEDAVEGSVGVVPAPARLNDEMSRLIAFKTATLTDRGIRRSGVWGEETVAQKLEHLGLMLGAMAAARHGDVQGLGVKVGHLTLALLVFPAVWDWYLRWRETRRGFYTQWEAEMLALGGALTRVETGWLRQTPDLANHLEPIDGLVSQSDIEAARNDWIRACDEVNQHVLHRSKEIERVARVHRDPFEPVLVVLESDNPLGTYRRITEEIIKRQPDADRYPLPAAESCRMFLMLRLGLHLGVRQKNLRQLLLCNRGCMPTSERKLELLKRGELRWNSREHGWEVFIPAVAFKNAGSSYFGKQPFRLMLPDLGQLYEQIDLYIHRHRKLLLGSAPDPGTFFVKTVKKSSRAADYDQNTFYEAWRLAIQRYGIYNPYTGRGAVEGLLSHGPHSVRDVLATHILKRTGSYEQASYAIQDTPDTVAKHYGRFLPKDKAALAARILNQVWEVA